jgi:hypothetical protein
LPHAGYALGVVARIGKRGSLVGYFFGPARPQIPSLGPIGNQLVAQRAVMVAIVGDLALLRGSWPILGKLEPWSRNSWPMPEFVRRDALSGRPCRVVYGESDFFTELSCTPCSEEEALGLASDGLMGSGFVEAKLGRLLSSSNGIA